MIWYTPFCVSYLILGQIHTKFPASVIVAYFLTAPFCCDDGMFLECMIISEFHLIKVILFTVVSHPTWIQNKVRRLECCCTARAMVISLITLHVKCSSFGSPKTGSSDFDQLVVGFAWHLQFGFMLDQNLRLQTRIEIEASSCSTVQIC